MSNRYLYFTHKDDVQKIISSKLISRKKAKYINTKGLTVLNAQNEDIVAFVYNIALISASKCYIAYPCDFLQGFHIIRWGKIFNFFPIPMWVKTYRIPSQLRAITFEIINEENLEHWFLSDKNLAKSLYCESVSAHGIRIKNITEINLTDALNIIGFNPPYIDYIDNYYLQRNIKISNNYEIGP